MLPQQVRSQGTLCSERSCLASGLALTRHLAVSGHTRPAVTIDRLPYFQRNLLLAFERDMTPSMSVEKSTKYF